MIGKSLIQLYGILVLFFIAVSGWTQDDTLPDVKTVLANYHKAIGGVERLKGVKTLKQKGTLSIKEMGLTAEFVSYQDQDGKMLMEMNLGDFGNQVIGFDGELGWMIGPDGQAIELPPEQVGQMKSQAGIFPLLEAEKKFDKLTISGPEEFDAKSCYALIAEKNDNEPITFFFDRETSLLMGMKGKMQAVGMGEVDMVLYYGEYSEVDNILYPMTATSEFPGITQIMEFEKIEQNVQIPTGKFDPPKSIK